MLHKTLKTSFRKTLVILCTLALLIGAVYVPVGINTVFAANSGEETVVFDFTDACVDATVNTNAKDTYGVGFFGWGPIPRDSSGDSTNKVLSVKKTATNQPWATSGGYRLNKMNSDGEYESYILEPSTSYAVSLKVRVLSSPSTISGSSATNETAVYIGYGAHYYSGLSGNRDNYFNRMYGNVQPIIKSLIDSGSFKLYSDSESYVTLNCSEEWHTVNYIISTPESTNGKFDLSVWTDMHTGINCEIDDVSVTKLGGEKGAVVLKDDYSGTTDILVGKVGDTLTLPDISDRILESDHRFEGWCKDEARTENITSMTFEEAVQTVYSKWASPVQITFVDTLNSTQTVVPGMPGEEIQFPTDPVDPNGEKWFMGWYTTEQYTVEFTDTEYGYSNVVVYSFFKGSIPGLTQGFENYSESDWTPETLADGTVRKSNKNQFGYAFEKQSEVTYNNSSYAVKLDWDSTMTKTGENVTNPEAYDAAARYNVDNVFYLGGGLENKQSYVVTFKYKVEKADTPLTFQMVSATYGNFWSNSKYYDAPVIIPTVSDEWQDGRLMFTTDYVNGYSTIFFKVTLSSNADTVIYFDDFEIQAFAQPYESVVVFDGQNGAEAIYCVGTRGDKIDIPSVSHPDDAVFQGWYLDKECTEEMDFDTYGRETVTVYAKWGSLPQNFSNYPFSTTNSNQFGVKTMSIDKTAGVGYNDSFALRFKFRGSDVNSVDATTGKVTYMYERAPQPNHAARIANNIEDGKLYKITYKYKTESSNNEFTIAPYTAWGENFWAAIRNTYPEVENVVKDTSSDWKEYTGYFVGRVSQDAQGHKGNALYISVVQSAADMNTSIDLLIDNVLVEECSLPFVKFVVNDNNYTVVVGEENGEIKKPEPKVEFGKEFDGWYLDKEFTSPFTQTVFTADTKLSVYAKQVKANKVTYTFENYDAVPHSATVGAYHLVNAVKVKSDTAYSGDYVIEFDRRDGVSAISGAVIEEGSLKFTVEPGVNYVATVKYRIDVAANIPTTINFMTAHHYNLWGSYAAVSPTYTVSPTEQTGVWKTVSLIIDSSLITIDKAGVAYNTLYVGIGGGLGGVIHIDDVTVETIPQGTAVAYIHTNGSKDIPQIIYGKSGESFANKLPKAPSLNGHVFKGYYNKEADGSMKILTEENMKFADKPVIVYATFAKKQIVQSFEENYLDIIKNAPAYSMYDFDFELYDKLKSGNSADNVASGRYSMHRIGNSHLIESVSVLSAGDGIEAGSVYKLSFKVKVGKHLHTDGAIKLSNIKTYNYAWATSGDARAVVAIKDIADGEWHEVSCVFHSIESFVALQTPGYVELFIDDVTFTLMEDGTQVSQPVEFTEYVPVKRDLTTGEILDIEHSTVDISTIVDSTLREEDLQSGAYTAIYVSVAAGVVLIVVAAFIIIAILRKKKKNG